MQCSRIFLILLYWEMHTSFKKLLWFFLFLNKRYTVLSIRLNIPKQHVPMSFYLRNTFTLLNLQDSRGIWVRFFFPRNWLWICTLHPLGSFSQSQWLLDMWLGKNRKVSLRIGRSGVSLLRAMYRCVHSFHTSYKGGVQAKGRINQNWSAGQILLVMECFRLRGL